MPIPRSKFFEYQALKKAVEEQEKWIASRNYLLYDNTREVMQADQDYLEKLRIQKRIMYQRLQKNPHVMKNYA